MKSLFAKAWIMSINANYLEILFMVNLSVVGGISISRLYFLLIQFPIESALRCMNVLSGLLATQRHHSLWLLKIMYCLQDSQYLFWNWSRFSTWEETCNVTDIDCQYSFSSIIWNWSLTPSNDSDKLSIVNIMWNSCGNLEL